MLKQKSHFTLAVLMVTAVMLVAGGVATGSNTGFKMNKAIEPTTAGGPVQKGNNWTSIPFFNPYGNVGAFCTQTGLITSGVSRDVVLDVDPVTGANTPSTCGTPGAAARLLVPGRGVRIKGPTTVAVQRSIIIVGSHNPSLSLTVPDSGAGQVGLFWFSVPYHTTAVTAADLCASAGLTSSGVARATIQRVNAVAGTVVPASCGTAGAGTLNLVLGEAVSIREPNGPVSFIPAHF